MNRLPLICILLLAFTHNVRAQEWLQVEKYLPHLNMNNAKFGYAMDATENYLIVGAYQYIDTFDGIQLRSGGAFLYKRNDSGEWEYLQQLKPLDPESNDYFGLHVAIDKNIAAVGAPIKQNLADPNLDYRGAVYLFEPDSTGFWRQTAKIGSDKDVVTTFGAGLEVNNGTLFIGTSFDSAYQDPQFPSITHRSGGVHVYSKDTDGKWTRNQIMRRGMIDTTSFPYTDFFGTALSSSGNHLMIGCQFAYTNTHPDSFLNPGAVYYYEKNGQGMWEFRQTILSPDGEINDLFGYSIDMSSSSLIVGAIGKNSQAGTAFLERTGKVYIYQPDTSTALWVMNHSFVAFDRNEGDLFGEAVFITDSTAVVGQRTDRQNKFGNGPFRNYSGSAYVLNRDASGEWSSMEKITAIDRETGNQFGFAVAISGKDVMVGCPNDVWAGSGNPDLFRAGSFYLFRNLPPPAPIQIGLRVFPNPSTGQFTVDLGSHKKITVLRVVNGIGQVLHEEEALDTRYHKMRLPEMPGLYLITAQFETGRINSTRVLKVGQ